MEQTYLLLDACRNQVKAKWIGKYIQYPITERFPHLLKKNLKMAFMTRLRMFEKNNVRIAKTLCTLNVRVLRNKKSKMSINEEEGRFASSI